MTNSVNREEILKLYEDPCELEYTELEELQEYEEIIAAAYQQDAA